MSIKAILFDLDGTLLPMDQDKFVKSYFGLLAERMAPYGYDPKQLVECVWKGTGAMVQNDGSKTNEERFWEVFRAMYGEERLTEHKPIIDGFYLSEFNQARSSCGFAPMARAILNRVRDAGWMPVLATNPIFPARATENRIRWAGLAPEEFELCTTYENSSFCKPNPEYYLEILNKLGLQPEECAMVGNDVEEDMIAATLGMKVFLLTDCLISRKGTDVSVYPHGDFDDLERFLIDLACGE